MSSNTLEKKRIVLVIQYLGADFYGWQRQPKQRTVQAQIEDVLSNFVGTKVVIHGAGRTDSGVHALQPLSPQNY